jgi:hypothetical protein
MILGRSMILAAGEAVTTAKTYPQHRLGLGDFASEVTFIVDVQSLNGAPTAALLTATIQGVMPHTTGNQYVTERVFNLGTAQAAALTVEGEDWPTVASEASSYPVTVQRTYRAFGKDLRLVLTPAFTGGTTPSFTVSVVAHAKG